MEHWRRKNHNDKAKNRAAHRFHCTPPKNFSELEITAAYGFATTCPCWPARADGIPFNDPRDRSFAVIRPLPSCIWRECAVTLVRGMPRNHIEVILVISSELNLKHWLSCLAAIRFMARRRLPTPPRPKTIVRIWPAR